MLRQKIGTGERQRYERVDPSHSWNSNNIATNVLLYHLQRHSDHHANPTRRYQTLRDFQESPVLPTGYAGMIVLAIVPAVWRRVMDPRVRGPLRRRPVAGEHQPPQARQDPRASTALDGGAASRGAAGSTKRGGPLRRPADEVLAARCPGAATPTRSPRGDEHEGFAAGTAWADVPDSWCCPDCGVREKVDFVPVDLRAGVGVMKIHGRPRQVRRARHVRGDGARVLRGRRRRHHDGARGVPAGERADRRCTPRSSRARCWP